LLTAPENDNGEKDFCTWTAKKRCFLLLDFPSSFPSPPSFSSSYPRILHLPTSNSQTIPLFLISSKTKKQNKKKKKESLTPANTLVISNTLIPFNGNIPSSPPFPPPATVPKLL